MHGKSEIMVFIKSLVIVLVLSVIVIGIGSLGMTDDACDCERELSQP